MDIIFNILTYALFAYIMNYLARKSYKKFPNSIKMDRYLILFILFYTIISAIRWRVGVDSVRYAYGFISGLTGHEQRRGLDSEYLIMWLVHFIHDNGFHFTVGMGVLGFVQIAFVTKALQPYKYILIYLPVVLFGSRYFLMEMNGMRQMIVASAFLFFSKFIVEKKPIHYVISIFIATLVHHSAFFLLPLFLIPNKVTKIADKRMLLFTIFAICFMFGLSPRFQLLVAYGESLAVISGYESYADRLVEYASQEDIDGMSHFGIMKLSYFLIVLSLIWFGPRLKKNFENVIPYFNLWFFFSFLWGCLYFMVCNVSYLFIRPISYFSLFEMTLVSLLLYDLYKKNKYGAKLVPYLYTLIIWMNISWNIVKANQKPLEETVTYKTFFSHKDEVSSYTHELELGIDESTR